MRRPEVSWDETRRRGEAAQMLLSSSLVQDFFRAEREQVIEEIQANQDDSLISRQQRDYYLAERLRAVDRLEGRLKELVAEGQNAERQFVEAARPTPSEPVV